MQLVGAGFCNQTELASGGMSIFGAELVRLERELGHRIRNHRGIVARGTEIVVIDSINAEIVIARTCSTHRTAHSLRSARRRNHIGSQNRQVQGTSVKHASRTGKIRHILCTEVIRQIRGSGLHLRRARDHFNCF